MNDAIRQLLRDADAANDATFRSSPTAPEALALRVRHRRDRRRRTTRYVATMASLALVMLAVWLMTITTASRTSSRTAPKKHLALSPPTPPTASDATTLARIDLNARLHEQTAAALLSHRRAARALPSHAVPAASDLQTERDRAALILVYEADRSVREKRPADAAANYRRAIALFPQSSWAQIARQRLKDLPDVKRIQS